MCRHCYIITYNGCYAFTDPLLDVTFIPCLKTVHLIQQCHVLFHKTVFKLCHGRLLALFHFDAIATCKDA